MLCAACLQPILRNYAYYAVEAQDGRTRWYHEEHLPASFRIVGPGDLSASLTVKYFAPTPNSVLIEEILRAHGL